MLSSDTRVMGCFVDVVWYDLNVTPERGRGHSQFSALPSQGTILGIFPTLCFNTLNIALNAFRHLRLARPSDVELAMGRFLDKHRVG